MKNNLAEHVTTEQTYPQQVRSKSKERHKDPPGTLCPPNEHKADAVILARVYAFILSWTDQEEESEKTESISDLS